MKVLHIRNPADRTFTLCAKLVTRWTGVRAVSIPAAESLREVERSTRYEPCPKCKDGWVELRSLGC